MSNYIKYQYFVEGQTEKKLIEILKKSNMIISGNVNIFNVIQKEFSGALLANLSKNTVVILIFDTDTNSVSGLNNNLRILKKNPNVRECWCIPQVKNLEDELIRATDITHIKDLIGSQSNTDFKRDWLREKHIPEKLQLHHFDYSSFWSSTAGPPFDSIKNNSDRIKIYTK